MEEGRKKEEEDKEKNKVTAKAERGLTSPTR